MTGQPGVNSVDRLRKPVPTLVRSRGLEGLSDHNCLWYTCTPPLDDDYASLIADSPPTIVRVYYSAQQSDAVRIFDQDASELARFGYRPTGQSWEAGRWGWRAFMVALLLAVILVGVLMFLYMLVVRPDGTLTVTYARRDARRRERPATSLHTPRQDGRSTRAVSFESPAALSSWRRGTFAELSSLGAVAHVAAVSASGRRARRKSEARAVDQLCGWRDRGPTRRCWPPSRSGGPFWTAKVGVWRALSHSPQEIA